MGNKIQIPLTRGDTDSKEFHLRAQIIEELQSLKYEPVIEGGNNYDNVVLYTFNIDEQTAVMLRMKYGDLPFKKLDLLYYDNGFFHCPYVPTF